MQNDIPGLYIFKRLLAEIPRSRNRSQRFTTLKILHNLFDRLVQLLVFAVPFFDRIIVNQDIRIYTVVFDDPLAGLRVIAQNLKSLAVSSW